MDKPTAAILLTALVHVVGVVALVWLALDGERFDWRGWWPRDEGGGDGPGDPGPAGPPDGVPLADAEPAGLRLRTEHERLAGARRRSRRPVHAPEPARTREPA